MAEEKKKVEEAKASEPKVDVAKFKARKLKVINEMSNKAHAQKAAERVLSN